MSVCFALLFIERTVLFSFEVKFYPPEPTTDLHSELTRSLAVFLYTLSGKKIPNIIDCHLKEWISNCNNFQ